MPQGGETPNIRSVPIFMYVWTTNPRLRLGAQVCWGRTEQRREVECGSPHGSFAHVCCCRVCVDLPCPAGMSFGNGQACLSILENEFNSTYQAAGGSAIAFAVLMVSNETRTNKNEPKCAMEDIEGPSLLTWMCSLCVRVPCGCRVCSWRVCASS